MGKRLKIKAKTVLLATALLLASPLIEASSGRFIVTLKKSHSPNDVTGSHSIKAKHKYSRALNGFSATLTPEQLEALKADARVASVEEDAIGEMNDLQTNAGWNLDRVDQRSLPLDGNYSFQNTGAGVKIYIMDGGINYSHQDFGGRAIPGWDVDGSDGSECVVGGGHGTRVASVAGGSTLGIAKGATLVNVKVYPCVNTALYASNVIAGIDWILANNSGPAVANFSSSFGGTVASINTAFGNLLAAGVSVTASAGNSTIDACNNSPQQVSGVMTIGSSDETDAKASWSNFGACVDWFAPGTNIPGADYLSTNGVLVKNGTSYSAPFSAGVAALYLQNHSLASPQDVQSALASFTTKNIVTNSQSSNNHLLYTYEDPMVPVSYAPVVALTNLVNGQTITKNTNFTITASASDQDGSVTSVKFFINGNLTCTDTSSPYSCTFKTSAKAGVNYSIYAEATDNQGNVTRTPTVSVKTK